MKYCTYTTCCLFSFYQYKYKCFTKYIYIYIYHKKKIEDLSKNFASFLNVRKLNRFLLKFKKWEHLRCMSCNFNEHYIRWHSQFLQNLSHFCYAQTEHIFVKFQNVYTSGVCHVTSMNSTQGVLQLFVCTFGVHHVTSMNST